MVLSGASVAHPGVPAGADQVLRGPEQCSDSEVNFFTSESTEKSRTCRDIQCFKTGLTCMLCYQAARQTGVGPEGQKMGNARRVREAEKVGDHIGNQISI